MHLDLFEFSVLMCMEFLIGILHKLINIAKNTRLICSATET